MFFLIGGMDDQWLGAYMKERDHLPASNQKGRVTVYKEVQSGSKPNRYERVSHQWVSKDVVGKSKSRQFQTGACKGVVKGAAVAGNKLLLNKGIGVATEVKVNAKKLKADCETHVLEADGIKFLNAGAGARVGTAGAGASATPLGAEAYAKACSAEADARAGLIEDVLEAKARAVTGEAQARAGVGLKDVGARAG